MQQDEIRTGSYHWSLRRFGRGAHLFIAFHGFGEDGAIFAAWRETLEQCGVFVAVDLPFHGKSRGWPELAFGPKEIAQLIESLQNGFEAYSLVGHSLGGRLLMATVPLLEHLPAAIWLLAPDGLATRRLGIANTIPAWGRKLIGHNLGRQYPQWLRLATRLRKIGLIDAFSVSYLRYNLSDRFRRNRLMAVWRSLTKFPVDRREWLKMAQNESPTIHLVLGETDKLINWKKLDGWLRQWPADQLHRLKKGHQLIDRETAELVRGGSGC